MLVVKIVRARKIIETFINYICDIYYMSKICKRCGADSGDYNLCKDCYFENQEFLGEYINNYKCKLCCKSSGGYSLCYNCRKNFDNGTYLSCIKCDKFKEDDKKLCKQCEEKTKPEPINIIQKKQEEIKSSELRDYRKKFDAGYKTIDGHYVRSRGEVMIADFLFRNKIRFVYEKRVCKNGEEYYPDFFLPDQSIYIEYWGSEDKNYMNLKQKKKEFYRVNKLLLIQIDNQDMPNLSDQLEKKLEKMGICQDWQ